MLENSRTPSARRVSLARHAVPGTFARPMKDARSTRRLIGLALLTAVFCWNALWFSPLVVDDAFISMRYARNLAQGAGLVYNPGERVEGFSNFLWVLIEAGLLAAGTNVVRGVQLIGLLSGAGAIWLTHALVRRVSAHREPAAWIASALLASSSSLALWSVAGLETSFFALLLVAAVWSFERELAAGRPRAASAALFALAWSTRPEAPAYLAYFLLRRLDLRWIAWLALWVVPYELFGLTYYGQLFPTTHAAKVGGGLQLELDGLLEFVRGGGWALPVLLVSGGLGCALGGRRLPRALGLPALAGLAFVLYAGVDWMPRFRFFVPVLPFLYGALAHGSLELLQRARAVSPWLARVAAVALAALGLECARFQLFGTTTARDRPGFAAADEARGFWPVRVRERLGELDWPQEAMALSILHTVPEGDTVAIADIGFPGYLTANPIFDLRGLVTPAVARWRHEPEREREALLAALREARPAYILIPSVGPSLEGIVDELAGAAWLRAGWQLREDPAARSVVYARNDLLPMGPLSRGAVRRRLEAALERLPQYDSELSRQALRALEPR